MKPKESLNFALIGAAGYIAPRHMKAIKETNNILTAALDPFDSVGIIDSFFPQASFFLEPERFDRHLYKKSRIPEEKIDFVSICSPNYLHDAHIRLALRNQANAICEKPLVLNPWNLDGLIEIEKEYEKEIFTILQLRLHPEIIKIKDEVKKASDKGLKEKYEVDLSYITSRGKWYDISWKGNESKSGGVATNIGIHFFDMLMHIFGPVESLQMHHSSQHKAAGYIELKNARVRWILSIDSNDLPKIARDNQQRTYRSITINGKEIEFSGGFTDLHTQSYQKIITNKGFRIQDAAKSIHLVHQIRNMNPIGLQGDYHPLLNNK
ncbi:MAG: Gfo/Idh/MocA family protein [Bacteroidales bacterium]